MLESHVIAVVTFLEILVITLLLSNVIFYAIHIIHCAMKNTS